MLAKGKVRMKKKECSENLRHLRIFQAVNKVNNVWETFFQIKKLRSGQ